MGKEQGFPVFPGVLEVKQEQANWRVEASCQECFGYSVVYVWDSAAVRLWEVSCTCRSGDVIVSYSRTDSWRAAVAKLKAEREAAQAARCG